MKNYYEVLKINPGAELIEIKKAYRRLALKFHPDKNDSENAARIFIEIHEAYQVLSDSQRRVKYDEFLHNAGQKKEVIIFDDEFSKNGKEKAKYYSQMPYEVYRKFISKEVGLKISYLPHFTALFFITVTALGLLISLIEVIINGDVFMTTYLLLISAGVIFLTIRMYKNIYKDYQINKELLK